ncbi:hypothetical protein NQ317_015133 [Molorchus minor]|uniref:Uncharacterized protein n=1 Tax=Molorchus minor TaxID=1323400 RepID=A0ABQ9K6J9_9CUCU|nr:hypothetical protein NQ317_015133 [Molorchus minor]
MAAPSAYVFAVRVVKKKQRRWRCVTVFLLLACTYSFLPKEASTSAIRAPLEIISLDDITPAERKELDHLYHKSERPKRSGSGSGDILDSLKYAIGQGIKKKIGQVAHASASATAKLSSGSSGHGYSDHEYSYPQHHYAPESYDHKSFDFWTLKKSILNTLLQAVKAIKGGVIAVKGQLIKGSGHLISAKGKLVKYGPPVHHYSAPSAPEDIYHGSHSAPGPEYHQPEHYPSGPPYSDGKCTGNKNDMRSRCVWYIKMNWDAYIALYRQKRKPCT